MKSTFVSKWNVMLLMAAGLFSASCTDDILPTDKTQKLPDGEFPLSFTALKDEAASRVTGKTAWIADMDIIGVRFGNDGQIGKYKISDAASGSTVAETPISWTTTTATINAWYPWSDVTKTLDISDQSVQEDQSTIDVLIAKAENANYNSDITLTFKHALPQVECTFEANGEGIDLAKLTDVKFLSASNLKFENGVLSKNTDSPVGVKPFKAAEGATYSAMIFPEDMSAKEFVSITYDGKEYQFKHDKANFESGKKYTFTIDIKKQAVAQWTVETLYQTTNVAVTGGDGVYGSADAYLYKPSSLAYNSSDNKLYVVQVESGNKSAVRCIDLATNTFSTIITHAEPVVSGFQAYNTCVFDEVNNMYVSQVRGSAGELAVAKGTKTDAGYEWSELTPRNQGVSMSLGIAINPKDQGYLYVSNDKAGLWRVDINSKTMELVSEFFSETLSGGATKDNIQYTIDFAPDGTFAYFVNNSWSKHHVVRADYNIETHQFENLMLIGAFDRAWAFANTSETNKLKDVGFSAPGQGTFDEEGNYYLCDTENNCIRRIDRNCSDDNPNSVTTFMGMTNKAGSTDGTADTAEFDKPHGIAYDMVNKVFYVSEPEKSRIRKISLK